jgi:hypothetical protein
MKTNNQPSNPNSNPSQSSHSEAQSKNLHTDKCSQRPDIKTDQQWTEHSVYEIGKKYRDFGNAYREIGLLMMSPNTTLKELADAANKHNLILEMRLLRKEEEQT